MALKHRVYAALRLLITRDTTQSSRVYDDTHVIDDYASATRTAKEMGTIITLDGGATDVAVDFGGVSAASTMLLLTPKGETRGFKVKLNGSATAIDVIPVPADDTANAVSVAAQSVMPGVLFCSGKVTSISLTNPDATNPVQVIVQLVGNAA